MRNLNTWSMKNLVPKSSSWAEITIRDTFPNAPALRGSLGAALEDANIKLHSHFVNRNFYDATTEALNDGICAGTYCVMVHDVPDEPLSYIPVPVDELYILLDKTKSKIDSVFRRHQMTGRMLMRKSSWKLPSELQDQAKTSPVKKFTILERVIPNEDTGKFDYRVTYGSRCKIINQAELEMNPFIVARWSTITGSPWGNSPARTALPDIRSVNQMVKDSLVFLAFAANGMWQGKNASMGDLAQIRDLIQPGGVIGYESEPFQPLEFPGRPELNFTSIDRIRQQINAHMVAPQMPSSDRIQYAKAETIQYLKEQWETLIGEPALKIEREFLKPIAEQTCARLFRRGELRVVDAAQLKSLGISSQVQSLSMLFQVDTNAALTRLLKQAEAQAGLQTIMQLSQNFGPQSVGTEIDTQKALREIAPALGVPARWMRDPQQADQLRQQLTQQMAQVAQSATQSGQAQGDPHGGSVDIQSLLTAFQGMQGQNPGNSGQQ